MKRSNRRCLIDPPKSNFEAAETTQAAEVERIQVLRWLASQLPEGILRFGRTCTGGSTWRLCQSRVLEIGKKQTTPQSFPICGVRFRFFQKAEPNNSD